jgi:hypothetical protein
MSDFLQRLRERKLVQWARLRWTRMKPAYIICPCFDEKISLRSELDVHGNRPSATHRNSQ